MSLSFLQGLWPSFLQPMSKALTLILLPALFTVIGGALVVFVNISKRLLIFIYHFSAGLVLGIVGIELVPEFIKHDLEWLIILIFVVGGAFFILVDWLTDYVRETLGVSGDKKSPWAIFAGLTVDLLSDGMLIASGSTIGNLGFPLAVATAVVAFPEAFTSNAAFKRRGWRGWKLVALSFVQGILMILGVPIGYFIVHGRPQIYTYSVLSFTAGFLSVLLAEEVLPRAHQGSEARLGAFLFLLGFAAVAMVSSYIG